MHAVVPLYVSCVYEDVFFLFTSQQDNQPDLMWVREPFMEELGDIED